MTISRNPAAELHRAVNAAAASAKPVRIHRVAAPHEAAPIEAEPLARRVGSPGSIGRVAPAPMANMPARRGGMIGGTLAERPDLGASAARYEMAKAPECDAVPEEGDAHDSETEEAR